MGVLAVHLAGFPVVLLRCRRYRGGFGAEPVVEAVEAKNTRSFSTFVA
jgi:hypothetical protein